jgi:general secretion pathway protein D
MSIKQFIVMAVALATLLPALAQNGGTGSAQTSDIRAWRGTDVVIAPMKPGDKVVGAESGLKFEEAPLSDVVQVILREIVKVNYVIHPPVTGTVTLSTQGDVSADYAMLMLEHALQANGLQMARDPRGTYHIGRPEIIKGIVPAVRQAVPNTPLSPGSGAIIIPLKYVGAAEMATILRPFAAAESIVRVDTVRNLLVMVGNRAQAEGWLDMVATFDVDLLKGMSVGVFPLKYISTKEVEFALRIMNTSSTASAQPAAAPSASGVATGATTFSVASPFYGALRIFPMETQNSVLVVTPRAAYLDEARQWLEKLDKPGSSVNEQQLFFYAVQNGSAAHLAQVLGGLYGSGAGANPTTPSNSGVAPGLAPATASTTGATFSTSTGVAASAGGKSNIQGGGLTSISLAPGVRVIADEINNAVLVYSSANEFAKVEATLKRLDVPLTQVLIEASIIEVSLTDGLKYGLQWMFSEQRGSDVGTGVLSTAANAALGATSAGFSYTLRNAGGDVRAVLNALAEKSLVKVISSPSLMVLNNHTASIVVGNQQPVQAGQTITTGGNISSNIQYKDTGVSLSVLPSVNAGNMVTMQINQAVSDVGPVDVATGQRSFLQRQIGSKVAVRSGETVVLGGLIRDNGTKGKSGVPWLQDIPVVGSLFGANTANTDRTELLVIITPKVVRSDQDIRKVSSGFRDSMKDLAGTWPALGKSMEVPEEDIARPRAGKIETAPLGVGK